MLIKRGFFFIIGFKKVHIQGILLPDRQTLRGDSRYEDEHY